VNKTKKEDALSASEAEILSDGVEDLQLNSQTGVHAGQTSIKQNDSKTSNAPHTGRGRQMASASRAGKALPKSDISVMIGESLQNVYDDILQQPVPDRFLELLQRLETSQLSTLSSSKKENS
jgi:hypothetical protein